MYTDKKKNLSRWCQMCHFQISHNVGPLVWARNTMPYVHARHKSINFLGYPSSAFLSAHVLGSALYNKVKKVYSFGNFIWFQGFNFSGCRRLLWGCMQYLTYYRGAEATHRLKGSWALEGRCAILRAPP